MRDMKEAIMEKLERVPENVKTCVLENFRVDGTVPITATQVHELMQSVQASVLAAITEQGARHQAALAAVRTEAAPVPVSGQSFQPWSWGGRFHPVPEDFRFPQK